MSRKIWYFFRSLASGRQWTFCGRKKTKVCLYCGRRSARKSPIGVMWWDSPTWRKTTVEYIHIYIRVKTKNRISDAMSGRASLLGDSTSRERIAEWEPNEGRDSVPLQHPRVLLSFKFEGKEIFRKAAGVWLQPMTIDHTPIVAYQRTRKILSSENCSTSGEKEVNYWV